MKNGERKGKGKEYRCGELIFESEYLNGKRNGKGKEYFNGKLIFEAEYLNGKKWNGKGKEYRTKTMIVKLIEGKGYMNSRFFKGEYKNGERNGKGKEYFNGKLIFEGEYLNWKKWNGKGYNNNNQIIYELKEGRGFIKENKYRGDLRFELEYLYGERKNMMNMVN